MKWVPGLGSGRGYERRKRWWLIMSVVEWFGRDYRHCQAQRTAEAQINRSAPHVFSFCLILEQQTMRKHESPCQTIMGPKSTSYIVCRWCKSIKSYQAKKTRAIEKCWSQVAGIFPRGFEFLSFHLLHKQSIYLRFALQTIHHVYLWYSKTHLPWCINIITHTEPCSEDLTCLQWWNRSEWVMGSCVNTPTHASIQSSAENASLLTAFGSFQTLHGHSM